MTPEPSATYVVRLTAPGRGAVASLALGGPGSADLLDRYLDIRGRQPSQLAVDQVALAQCPGSGTEPAAREEVVLVRVGPEQFELHCHGGEATAARRLAELAELGFNERCEGDRAADPPRDRIQRLAEQAFREARTPRTAALLWNQVQGSLSDAVKRACQLLRSAAGQQVCRELSQWLRWAPLGLHLARPWQVVVAGPPNVGKSSLLNALAGYPRAIVFDQPGTTRDLVRVSLAWDGWPIEFCDTAGVRATDDPLEQLGIAQAQSALGQADLVLWVCDGGPSAGTGLPPGAARSATWLTVENKSDLRPKPTAAGSAERAIWVSAITGAGIQDLGRAVVERLIPEVPPPGAPLLFDPRLVLGVQAALAALETGDWDGGRQELENLLR